MVAARKVNCPGVIGDYLVRDVERGDCNRERSPRSGGARSGDGEMGRWVTDIDRRRSTGDRSRDYVSCCYVLASTSPQCCREASRAVRQFRVSRKHSPAVRTREMNGPGVTSDFVVCGVKRGTP